MSRSITIIRESRVGVPGLMLESMNFRQLYEAVESDDNAKKGFMKKLWEKFRDNEMVDLGLDLLGLLAGNITGGATVATGGVGAPTMIIAMIPDLLNAFRRFARGDKFQGALSLICAIPFAGDVLADLIAAKRLFGDKTKVAISAVETVAQWAKSNRPIARASQAASDRVVDSVAEHVPGMQKHREEMKKAVDIMVSGDVKKIEEFARESGVKIATSSDEPSGSKSSESKPKKSRKKEALAEGHPRRSYKLVDLYEGTLYES